MRRRSTLIGFTEAELGFVIAAVIALTVAVERPSPAITTPVAGTVIPPRDTSHESAADSLILTGGRGGAGDAERRAEQLSKVKMRDCSELGLPRSPLPVITVVDSFRYALNGRTMKLGELRRLVAPAEADGIQRKCLYALRFRLGDAVPHGHFRFAVRTFRGHFVVEDAGNR